MKTPLLPTEKIVSEGEAERDKCKLRPTLEVLVDRWWAEGSGNAARDAERTLKWAIEKLPDLNV